MFCAEKLDVDTGLSGSGASRLGRCAGARKYGRAGSAQPQEVGGVAFFVCNNSEHGAEGLLLTPSRLWEGRTGRTGGCGHGLADRVPQ